MADCNPSRVHMRSIRTDDRYVSDDARVKTRDGFLHDYIGQLIVNHIYITGNKSDSQFGGENVWVKCNETVKEFSLFS